MGRRHVVFIAAIAIFPLVFAAFATAPASGPARLLKDINDGPTRGAYPGVLAELHGTVLFEANDGLHGVELWRTDGTQAGTVLVKDVNPGGAGSSPGFNHAVEVSGDTVYFAAEDRAHGIELWRTDGTEEGTVLVKDINTQSIDGFPYSAYPTTPTGMGGDVYFAADDGIHGYELWKSDGTDAGTVLVKDINPDNIAWGMVGWFSRVDGALLFAADDGVHGNEFWRTDGTEEGTVLVKDIYPGDRHSIGLSIDRAQLGGSILFRAEDPAHGTELWKSDGMEAGTVLVKDLCPGPCHGFIASLTGSPIIDGSLYFQRYDFSTNGSELWRTDGTEEGTVLVKAFHPGSFRGLTIALGRLVFYANDGVHGLEPWTSDGTEEGTVLLSDIHAGSAGSNDTGLFNSGIHEVEGLIYFTADDGIHGLELWRSDGTEEGTALVRDIAPGPASSQPAQVTEVEGRVLFKADDGVHGAELWRSDGTEEGTVLVQDTSPGSTGSGAFFPFSGPFLSGNHVLMPLDDGPHGVELWSGRAAVVTGQPVRAVQDLSDEVAGLHLPGGLGRVLGRELDEAAQAAADPTRSRVAVVALERFKRKVETLSRHMISDEERASLIEFVQDITALLGGSPGSTRHARGWETSRP